MVDLPGANGETRKGHEALVTKAKMDGTTLHERSDSHHGWGQRGPVSYCCRLMGMPCVSLTACVSPG